MTHRIVRRITVVAGLTVAGWMAESTAGVLAIQFDMGTSQGSYTGSASPAHALGDIPGTNVTWNAVPGGTEIISSGLVYSDGTAATGVVLDGGAGFNVSDANSWNYGNFTISYGYGPGVLTPFYDNTLMRDYLYNSNGVGFRVNGLPAGQYNVYALASDSSLKREWNIGIAVNPGVSPLLDAVIGDKGATPLTSWVAATNPPSVNDNYYLKTVSIAGPSDWIGVIMTARDDSAGLAGLQIVQFVPEPASLSLLVLGGLALLRRRNR